MNTVIKGLAIPRSKPSATQAQPTSIQRVPMPKQRALVPKVTPALRALVKEYKKVYTAVYGIRPTMTFDGTWIRIQGMTAGVTPKRLKEMLNQLRYRA